MRLKQGTVFPLLTVKFTNNRLLRLKHGMVFLFSLSSGFPAPCAAALRCRMLRRCRLCPQQVAFVNLELPPQDIGTAMKPQQMVGLLEEHIVGQVGYAPESSYSSCRTCWRSRRCYRWCCSCVVHRRKRPDFCVTLRAGGSMRWKHTQWSTGSPLVGRKLRKAGLPNTQTRGIGRSPRMPTHSFTKKGETTCIGLK